jgi:hypothetical protein
MIPSSSPSAPPPPPPSPLLSSANRVTAVVIGGVSLLSGIAGLVISAGMGMLAAPGRLLLGVFSINPAGAAVDILIAAAVVIAGLSTVAAAKIVNTIVGAVFLVLGLAGLFVIGTGFNVLALNGADNVAHFAGSVVLLAVGLGAERSVKTPVTS